MLLLALLLALAADAQGQQKQRAVFVMGGRSDYNPDIYSRIIQMAGGAGVARVGIVSAASSDPEGSGHAYEEVFQNVGAVETYWIPVQERDPAAAMDPAVVAKVSISLHRVTEMTAIFFSGGDQARIVSSLFVVSDDRTDTPVMAAIREAYETGAAVMAGDSAGGTVMTGSVMMLGGTSYNALLKGAQLQSPFIDDLVYDPLGGIGFLPQFVLDTHFSQRGREGRLIRLLSDTVSLNILGVNYGIGVDEDTALLVTSDLSGENPKGEVLGTNGVYFADVSRAQTDQINGEWAIDTVYTHYLRRGDRIDLREWTDITYANYKFDLAGKEAYVAPVTSDAIFDGNLEDPDVCELTRVATNLMDSKVSTTFGDTYEDRPKFRVFFEKGDFTKGYGGYPEGPLGIERDFSISYQDLIVDIEAL